MLLLIEPSNSEFYSVAPDRELSSIVKKEMEKTIKASPLITDRFKIIRSEITCLLNNSKMIALATSDNRMDGRKANVFVGDEVGALKNRYPVQAMESSQMNLKNRLGVLISTAYQSTDNPMTQEVEYAEKVMDGIIEDETLFSLLYKPDNPKEWDSDKAIYQANPLCYKVPDNYDYLIKQRDAAIEMGGVTKSNYLTKHLNIFVDGDVDENYIQIEDFQANKIDEFDWVGKEVYVGVDLAETIDNTAVSIVHYDESTEKFYVKSWSFIPNDRAPDKTKTERIDYFRFRDEGWCYLVGDRTIDQRFVEDFVLKLEERYGVIIRAIGYDRRNANSSKRRWEDEGGYDCIEVVQNDRALGTPFKLMRDKILDGDFHYTRNDLLENNFKNAKQLVNTNMGIYVTKKQSTGKIDMVFSTVDAVYLWNRDIEEGLLHGAYEDRGIIVL